MNCSEFAELQLGFFLNPSTRNWTENSGLCHYRGNRAGRQSYHRNIQVATFDQRIFHISTVISHHRPRLRTDSRTADFSNLSYLRPTRRFNPGDHKVRFAVWNAQSINHKSSIICDIILSNHLDMFAVTETWLSSDSNTSIASILNSLNDFIVWQAPRVIIIIKTLFYEGNTK